MKPALTATMVVGLLGGAHFCAEASLLGTADAFAVLAGYQIHNSGRSTLWGDLGTAKADANAIGGSNLVVYGTSHIGDAMATRAIEDAQSAYYLLLDESPDLDLSGQNLGGMTLLSGVYRLSSATSMLSETLNLDARGDPNARFVFQIDEDFETAGGSRVNVINGGTNQNVFWLVGRSARLGAMTDFAGNILAGGAIDLGKGASLLGGRVFSMTASVAMNSNHVSAYGPDAVPEPATFALLAVAAITSTARRRRHKNSV